MTDQTYFFFLIPSYVNIVVENDNALSLRRELELW